MQSESLCYSLSLLLLTILANMEDAVPSSLQLSSLPSGFLFYTGEQISFSVFYILSEQEAYYMAACPAWCTLRTAQRCSPQPLQSHHHSLSASSPWCTQSQVLSAGTAVAVPQKWKCRDSLQGKKDKPSVIGKQKRHKNFPLTAHLSLSEAQIPCTCRLTCRAEGSWDAKALLLWYFLEEHRPNSRQDQEGHPKNCLVPARFLLAGSSRESSASDASCTASLP